MDLETALAPLRGWEGRLLVVADVGVGQDLREILGANTPLAVLCEEWSIEGRTPLLDALSDAVALEGASVRSVCARLQEVRCPGCQQPARVQAPEAWDAALLGD